MPRYEPLRITAYLQTPIICDEYLPLDAALFFTAVRKVYGEQPITLPGQSTLPDGPVPALPIDRTNRGEAWFYRCSFAEWPEDVAVGQDHWNKRLDQSLAYLVDFDGRRGNVDIGSAHFKAYHMPIFYRHALYVRWYVMGTRDKLERLLRFTNWLGKKTSQGWGAVMRWEVEPWPEDWSIHNADGRLMRAIPKEGGSLHGIRPSYWNPRHQFECELPNAQ